VPDPGDFKRTAIGERSVILTRALDGSLNVVENVCAHRGVTFCRARSGNVKDFTCPITSGTTTSRATCRAFRSGAA
jgi:salicylate 5-hydroxylase large subunit